MKILLVAPIGFNTNKKVQAIHGGYGNASYGMLYVLDRLKKEGIIKELKVVDTSALKYDIPEGEFDIAILNYSLAALTQNEKAIILLKNILSKAKKRYYHIAWETDPLPSTFKFIFKDEFFHGFLAPSHWGVNVIKKETNKPVYYFPHYVSNQSWQLLNIDEKLNEKIFTVLFTGQNTIRKGVQDALIGFAKALGDKEDCQLFLKLTPASQYELPITEQLASLLYLNQLNLQARINYIDTSISNEELNDIYEMSSVLLFCSRGEGFGLPSAEAMLKGLPVIYSNFSASIEVCRSSINMPLDVTIDEAYSMAPYGYTLGTKYGIPKIEDIIMTLQFLYNKWKENKKEYYELARINRKMIIDKFSYIPLKEIYEKILISE